MDINSPGATGDCLPQGSGAPTSPYDVGIIDFDMEPMPTPPHDNNNLAAWYDTDC